MAYVRTVRTASGARAVQIVYSSRRGSRDIEHLGSAHTDSQWELLVAAARQKIASGQGQLDLGLEPGALVAGGPLPITSARMGHLTEALAHAYHVLGFDSATGRDQVFRALVLARVIEPTSKRDSVRVMDEAGIPAPSYRTIQRRLRVYAGYRGGLRYKDVVNRPGGVGAVGAGAGNPRRHAKANANIQRKGPGRSAREQGSWWWASALERAGGPWRARIAKACAAHVHLGEATLLLYDVTSLGYETHKGDGFRESGFSKSRRLEPQITLGLLTDASGFPLMVHAFEGNKGETKTMIPALKAFAAAYQLRYITIVADAGMISEYNMKAIEEEPGWSFILGARTPEVPYLVNQWRQAHPGLEIPDGHVFTQPWPAPPSGGHRDHTYFYQYKRDRARRTLRGIDAQIVKAEKAVRGEIPVKRVRFVTLAGGMKTINTALVAKARALAGIKAYATNIPDPDPEKIIATYSKLLNIEQSFKLSKQDLAARPIYHFDRYAIEAHLTIVLAALAVTRWIEATTGWSIRRFVTTARRYRTITIATGTQTITAADPLPPDLTTALDAIYLHTK